jgi:hypothetical protein
LGFLFFPIFVTARRITSQRPSIFGREAIAAVGTGTGLLPFIEITHWHKAAVPLGGIAGRPAWSRSHVRCVFVMVALVGVPRSYWQVSLIVAPALSTTPTQHEAVWHRQ